MKYAAIILIVVLLAVLALWAQPSPANAPHVLAWSVVDTGAQQSVVLVQGSPDLTNWVDLASFPDATGDYTYTDTNNLPQRFYRAMAMGSYQVVTNLTLTNSH